MEHSKVKPRWIELIDETEGIRILKFSDNLTYTNAIDSTKEGIKWAI